MRTVKAIMIDVNERSVKEVEIGEKDGHHLYCMYDAIGCQLITLAPNDGLLADYDSLFVDDEGLLTMTPDSMFFYLKGCHQPFVGNGLIMGSNDDGDTTNYKTSIDEVRKSIKFLTFGEARAWAHENG